LTEGLTFIAYTYKASIFIAAECLSASLTTIDNSPPVKIVRRQLDYHLIPGKDLYEMLSHSTGNMTQKAVAIFKFHPKHGIRQDFNHDPFDFNGLFLGHTLFLRQAILSQLHGQICNPSPFFEGISYEQHLRYLALPKPFFMKPS
jgi:hypothetical protein